MGDDAKSLRREIQVLRMDIDKLEREKANERAEGERIGLEKGRINGIEEAAKAFDCEKPCFYEKDGPCALTVCGECPQETADYIRALMQQK